MMCKKKKWLLVSGILLLLVFPLFVSAQLLLPDANKLQLANSYYQSKQYEKASVMYKELHEITGSPYYFEVYLTCLIEMSDYDSAEKEIKRELRRTNKDVVLYVHWSYLLKKQNLLEEGDAMLDKAIESVGNSKPDYIRLANTLISRGEYEYAERLYMEGRRKLAGENFHYELGRIYLYQRNYGKMFQEYLSLIREDETAMISLESVIPSAFRLDADNSLREQLQNMLLKQMQKEPDVLAFNRLLIWFFMQGKNFSGALRQQIALDKRTGQEELQIIELARISGRNNEYEEALKAYDYLIEKGRGNPLFREAQLERMHLLYLRFTKLRDDERSLDLITGQFEKTITSLGFSTDTYQLILDYVHFLAFWSGQTENAISLLQDVMLNPGLTHVQQDELKTVLADINVFNGDMWEAVLLYSQVIESSKTSTLGDEVKLKKAKLGYYMGELNWAKAQLDVIKASTSKLVANDAMELSLFIGNNMNLGTNQTPVQMFARADLYSFRKEYEKAWAVLDSIEQVYPYNSLIDDIYFRKASLLTAKGEFEQAATYLEKIRIDYPYDLLGDDALFKLAEIYEQHLNQKAKALELYKNMLEQYPGSVYVTEARKKYRELRGDYDTEQNQDIP